MSRYFIKQPFTEELTRKGHCRSSLLLKDPINFDEKPKEQEKTEEEEEYKHAVPDQSNIDKPLSEDVDIGAPYPEAVLKTSVDCRERLCIEFNLSRTSDQETITEFLTNNYSFDSFGKLSFRKFKIKGKFRKFETVESLANYSEEPLYKPLLQDVDENKKKAGLDISNSILQGDSIKLVEILNQDHDLIDETYAQLIKYTRSCPNDNTAITGWKLFTVISSLFYPTDALKPYVFAHMYLNGFINNSAPIRHFAKFSFIRLSDRLLSKTQKNEEDHEVIKRIPYATFYNLSMFNTSLYEIFWAQKHHYPNLPVPLPLHLIIRSLIRLGIFETENPFATFKKFHDKRFIPQLVANLPQDVHALQKFEVNPDVPEDQKLQIVLALLKYWIQSLADTIVPFSYLEKFIELAELKRYPAIIVSLTSVNQRTFAYLIGFFRDVISHEDKNHVTKEVISDNFGKLFVYKETEEVDELIQRKLYRTCPLFCEYALHNLDSKDLYPLNPAYLSYRDY